MRQGFFIIYLNLKKVSRNRTEILWAGFKSSRGHVVLALGRHFATIFSAWRFQHAVPNYSHTYLYSKKKNWSDRNISVSSKAGRDNCSPMYSASVAFLRVRTINREYNRLLRLIRIISCTWKYQLQMINLIIHKYQFQTHFEWRLQTTLSLSSNLQIK